MKQENKTEESFVVSIIIALIILDIILIINLNLPVEKEIGDYLITKPSFNEKIDINSINYAPTDVGDICWYSNSSEGAIMKLGCYDFEIPTEPYWRVK